MFIHYRFGYITLNGVKIKKGKMVWKSEPEELHFKNTDEKAWASCAIMAIMAPGVLSG